MKVVKSSKIEELENLDDNNVILDIQTRKRNAQKIYERLITEIDSINHYLLILDSYEKQLIKDKKVPEHAN